MVTGRKGAEDFAEKGTIHLNDSSGLKGLTIAYPDQEFPEVVPYPWTISSERDPDEPHELQLVLDPEFL